MDYDPAMVWREAWRRARKQHRCEECSRPIDPGERYHFVTGLNEPGDPWWSAKQCGQCYEAARWLSVVCAGYLLTDVLRELVEHMEEEPYPLATLQLGKLIVLMRRRWVRRGERVPAEEVRALVDRALVPYLAKLAAA